MRPLPLRRAINRFDLLSSDSLPGYRLEIDHATENLAKLGIEADAAGLFHRESFRTMAEAESAIALARSNGQLVGFAGGRLWIGAGASLSREARRGFIQNKAAAIALLKSEGKDADISERVLAEMRKNEMAEHKELVDGLSDKQTNQFLAKIANMRWQIFTWGAPAGRSQQIAIAAERFLAGPYALPAVAWGYAAERLFSVAKSETPWQGLELAHAGIIPRLTWRTSRRLHSLRKDAITVLIPGGSEEIAKTDLGGEDTELFWTNKALTQTLIGT